MADRKEVKELLQRASVEIANTLKRADDMSEAELEEVSGGLASPAIRAFFDQNGHCAGLANPASKFQNPADLGGDLQNIAIKQKQGG